MLRQLWVFVTSYPDLLAAIAGFGLLVMAGVTSITIATSGTYERGRHLIDPHTAGRSRGPPRPA